MKVITMHAAKTNLSKLIEKACAGEEIIIARGAVPLVKLVPVGASTPGRRFGALKGSVKVPDEFFEPLPRGELRAWEK